MHSKSLKISASRQCQPPMCINMLFFSEYYPPVTAAHASWNFYLPGHSNYSSVCATLPVLSPGRATQPPLLGGLPRSYLTSSVGSRGFFTPVQTICRRAEATRRRPERKAYRPKMPEFSPRRRRCMNRARKRRSSSTMGHLTVFGSTVIYLHALHVAQNSAFQTLSANEPSTAARWVGCERKTSRYWQNAVNWAWRAPMAASTEKRGASSATSDRGCN